MQCPDDSESDSAIYPPLIPLQIVFVVSEPLLRSHRVRRIHYAQVTFGLQWVGIIPFQLARPPAAAQGKEREKLIDLSRSSPLCTVDAGATPLSTLGPVASPEPQPQSLSRRQSALLLVVPAFLCLGARYQVLSSTFVLRRRRRDSGEPTLETFLALPSPF